MERRLWYSPVNIKIDLPKAVLEIFDIIKEYGAESFIVGGSVRNSMLHIPVKDWDICTPAPAIELKNFFEGKGYYVIETGLKHGTITVMIDGEGYEITTYRQDGNYSDGRHPDTVEFVSDLETDLSRRDFTINAIAYNPEVGIVDPFGGLLDIQYRIIRCVGNPKDRFKEDALRILRAIRFAAVLGFDVEEKTHDAIMKLKGSLTNISMERINSEFCKILDSQFPWLDLRDYKDVIGVFIPEIIMSFGFKQDNPYHCNDVYEHMLHALEYYSPFNKNNDCDSLIVRLAIFFHDIGKPYCKTVDDNGVGHFYHHAKIGAKMTDEIMRRMKFDNETREAVVELISYHDAEFIAEPKYVKRWLNKIGEKQFRRLLALREADIYGQDRDFYNARYKELKEVENVLEEVLNEEQCFSLKDLAINGKDLIEIGFKPGKELGKTLNELLEMVIDGEENNKENLLQRAKERLV